MITGVMAVALTALGVSISAPVALIPLLRRARAIDRPNSRSSHAVDAIRGLGLGVLVAVLAGFIVAALFALGSAALLGIVAVTTVAITLIGLREDIVGIRSSVRAALQFLTGLLAALSVVFVLDAPWWIVPIVGFLFAASVNVANFMDGVNGISGLHGAAVGAGYAVIGALWEQPWLVVVGVSVAASFLGFLVWNLVRPGTFLGDAGSYLLGGVVAIAGIVAVVEGAPFLAIVAPSLVYLADTGATLIRRMANAEPWYEAHRSHSYQRLTDVGMSHVAVATIVAGATSLLSAAGIVVSRSDGPTTSFMLAGMGAVLVLYLLLPRLLGHQPDPPPAPSPPSSVPPRGWTAPSHPRVVVVGATGFVGSHVFAALTAEGAQVTGVVAPRMTYSGGMDAVDVVSAARTFVDDESLSELMRGADVVINAAGLASPDGAATESLLGANALLPAVLMCAAQDAGVARFVHLSSAAVQGRRAVLDESAAMSPFSAYSRSKALGEAALMHLAEDAPDGLEVVILRATSVQGADRPTTLALRRFARSPLSSVAFPPSRPSVVSSIAGLSAFVVAVCRWPGDVPTVVLQPAEGMTTGGVLTTAGGRAPRVLPAALCRVVVGTGYVGAALMPRLSGAVRRVEVMWFGQAQNAGWARSSGWEEMDGVTAALSADGSGR